MSIHFLECWIIESITKKSQHYNDRGVFAVQASKSQPHDLSLALQQCDQNTKIEKSGNILILGHGHYDCLDKPES